jgi:low affinity Fe/Cu permease
MSSSHKNTPAETIPASKRNFFERFSTKVTQAVGSTPAFIIAFSVVLIWALTGPFFDYSETWQLIINTSTTIVTFLMVFLIQKSQNKDALAIQLKLNELVASHEVASNRLIDVESLTEEELKVIQKYYSRLSERTKSEVSIHQSHSLDEADTLHEIKKDKKSKQHTKSNHSKPNS